MIEFQSIQDVVTIPRALYAELLEAKLKLDILADDIRRNVDSGRGYSIVDEKLTRLFTGTLDYTGKPAGTEAPKDE